ncbi:Deoxycytidine monophosphate (dCMP) deaminase [Spiromyces aspiralis]|uniref:Deoxycytidine monophosphate (dCMP) deaminase n=1 Tax=Spiromyces aspiralis TaxID=68401 RepID=A0ACC1HJ49_9FUNG|nr:Deoxycytidine monophosphate (dCMP) deaminase [Spiromyces aspiralis]
MFIAVIGSTASGRQEIVDYLVKREGFTEAFIGKKLTREYLAGKPNEQANQDQLKSVRFDSEQELLNYVTPRWREKFVTRDLDNTWAIQLFKQRPFFLLIAVNAPLRLRFSRKKQKREKLGLPAPDFEQFVDHDDTVMFELHAKEQPIAINETMDFTFTEVNSPVPPLRALRFQTLTLHDLITLADVYISNTFSTVKDLHTHLAALNLTDPERLRPSWDTYFMLLAELAAHRSNCMKRRVGCILVRDHQIIATGYNGTPKGIRNCNEGGCPRCNVGTPRGVSLDYCLCIHAEENALLEAGRGRVGADGNCVLYCNTCPCLGCAKKIVQVGVKEVVYSREYGMDELTAKLFKEANVIMRQHAHPSLKLDIHSF